MKTATHPSGQIITFDQEKHQYILGETELTSVTTIIKDLFPKFDAENIATKKAAKDKVSVQSLLDSWEKTRSEASTFGNLIHTMAEMIISTKDMGSADELPTSERERAYLEALKLAFAQINKNFHFVEVEKIIFAPQEKLAGTIDLLLKSKTTGNFVIADYKTTKKIDRYGFGGQKGLGICKHLQNCNYIHYSLQLSIYRAILLNQGYVANGSKVSCAMIHLHDDGPIAAFNQIAPKDLSSEANRILALR